MTTWSAAESMLLPGFMEPEELDWLHAQASRFDTVVEVGCWRGRSTTAIAAGCAGKVWTVDHFQGSPGERDAAHADALTIDLRAEIDFTLAPYPHVRVLAMSSLEASRLFNDASVEMIFLDGDHAFESVLVDLVSWRPRCQRLLCGHDRDWQDVSRALAVYGVPFALGPGSIWFAEVQAWR